MPCKSVSGAFALILSSCLFLPVVMAVYTLLQLPTRYKLRLQFMPSLRTIVVKEHTHLDVSAEHCVHVQALTAAAVQPVAVLLA